MVSSVLTRCSIFVQKLSLVNINLVHYSFQDTDYNILNLRRIKIVCKILKTQMVSTCNIKIFNKQFCLFPRNKFHYMKNFIFLEDFWPKI